jgi:hypothetical protein
LLTILFSKAVFLFIKDAETSPGNNKIPGPFLNFCRTAGTLRVQKHTTITMNVSVGDFRKIAFIVDMLTLPTAFRQE